MPDEITSLEHKIESLLSDKTDILGDVVSTSFLSKGKWIRAGLLMLIAKICSHSDDHLDELVIDAALGIELLHAATLLHDDVIDGADMRRGMPTTRYQHGNKYAILLGDVYIAEALASLNKCGSIPVIGVICQAAQTLAEGEIYQLRSMGNINLGWQEYCNIISRKTAALFAAAAEIGCILTKEDDESRKIACDIGYNLGIAFQIMDDLADYFSEQSQSGKAPYIDLEERNLTLPIIRFLEVAAPPEKRIVISYFQNEQPDGIDSSSVIKHLLLHMEQYGVRDYCLQYARQYVDKVLSGIAELSDGDTVYADVLREIANTIV